MISTLYTFGANELTENCQAYPITEVQKYPVAIVLSLDCVWWGLESASLLPWENLNDPEEDPILVVAHVSKEDCSWQVTSECRGIFASFDFFRWDVACLSHLLILLSSLSSSSPTPKCPLNYFSISSSSFIMDLVASVQGNEDKRAMLMFPKSLQAEWRLLTCSDELTMEADGHGHSAGLVIG